MTELRRRMDEAMIVRGMADRTREAYLWAVTGLAKFYHWPPDQISDAEVQAYLLHLIHDRQRSWSTCNIIVHGLRFFFHETLKRDGLVSDPSRRSPADLAALRAWRDGDARRTRRGCPDVDTSSRPSVSVGGRHRRSIRVDPEADYGDAGVRAVSRISRRRARRSGACRSGRRALAARIPTAPSDSRRAHARARGV
jgi:hypothetical protein